MHQLSTLIVVGLVAGAAMFIWHLLHRVGPPTRTDARFATRRDLAGLVSRHPVPGRISLGTRGRRILSLEPRHSLLVIGPPQTGKTAGLAIPAILEWPGPVLVTSSKPDVLGATHAIRAARGEVMVYDPYGESTIGWSPLHGARTWDGALAAAHALMATSHGTTGAQRDFWYDAAEGILAPLLLAAAHAGDMTRLVEWMDRGEDADADVTQILATVGAPLAQSAWRGLVAMDPRTRSGVIATLRTVLGAWWDPRVLGAARPELVPERLISGAHSLYLIAPTHTQARLASIYGAIVTEMTTGVYARHLATGTPLDPPLLVVLDEAAHIAPVRELAMLAATGPEPGIQLVTIFHDHAQIAAIYRERAASVIANHRARMFLPGIGDPRTLTEVSRALGETSSLRTTHHRARTGRSTTTQPERQPLMSADAIRQLPAGRALVVYGSRPAVVVALRMWFQADSGLGFARLRRRYATR